MDRLLSAEAGLWLETQQGQGTAPGQRGCRGAHRGGVQRRGLPGGGDACIREGWAGLLTGQEQEAGAGLAWPVKGRGSREAGLKLGLLGQLLGSGRPKHLDIFPEKKGTAVSRAEATRALGLGSERGGGPTRSPPPSKRPQTWPWDGSTSAPPPPPACRDGSERANPDQARALGAGAEGAREWEKGG